MQSTTTAQYVSPAVAALPEGLKVAISSLLVGDYGSHDIALALELLHNSLPAAARQGRRMEIRVLSPEYVAGGFDAIA